MDALKRRATIAASLDEQGFEPIGAGFGEQKRAIGFGASGFQARGRLGASVG